jgi:hypothetical protein
LCSWFSPKNRGEKLLGFVSAVRTKMLLPRVTVSLVLGVSSLLCGSWKPETVGYLFS